MLQIRCRDFYFGSIFAFHRCWSSGTLIRFQAYTHQGVWLFMASPWVLVRFQRSIFLKIAGMVLALNIVSSTVAQVPQAWSWSADHPEAHFQSGNASTEKLFQALRKRGSYEMKHMALKEALKHLADQFEIQILIDEDGLGEEAVTVEEPIELSLTDVPLSHALHWILSPLNLTYSIDSEVLHITSSHGACCLVVYDVTRITTDREDSPSRGNSLSQRTMIYLIETSIASSDWMNQGGLSTIEWFRDNAGRRHLLVNAPLETHQRIEAFLSVLCQGRFPARWLRESYGSSRELRILNTSSVRTSNLRRTTP